MIALEPLLAALQFLTRFPVRRQFSDHNLADSLLFYPLVGLLIGIVLMLPVHGLSHVPAVGAAITLAVWVLITGGRHRDGLADSGDAWAGWGGNRERSLEIMKDPHSGPFAVVVIVLTLTVKFAALQTLVAGASWLPVLLVPAIARATVVGLFVTTPYVRADGLGSTLASGLQPRAAWLSIAVTVLLCLLAGAFAMLLTALVLCSGLRWLMTKHLGGMSGDTIGACVEICEAGALAIAASLL